MEPTFLALRIGGPRSALALATLAAACSVPDEIFIGSAAPAFFLSPGGLDGNPGTRDKPWRTFAFAVAQLTPGSTLILLDGVYQGSDSGYPDIRCGINAAPGTPAAPITLRADHERGALLKGDNLGPPFFMLGCSHWNVTGLRAESNDFTDAPSSPEAGSVFVLGPDNHHITLRRLLGAHPNRYRHSHGLRVGERSSHVLIEECELYDFHHNGFEIVLASDITVRRNYANARNIPDLPGGFVSDPPSPTGGDHGVFLESVRQAVVENNVMESLFIGIGLSGRKPVVDPAAPSPPPPEPLLGNRLLGNLVLGATGSGFSFASTCFGATPCVDPARIVTTVELTDNVVVNSATGIRSTGAIDLQINQFSAIQVGGGIEMTRVPDNAGLAPSFRVSNALVTGFDRVAFLSIDQAQGNFDHCAATGMASPAGVAFSPDDASVTNRVAVEGVPGDCPAYLPAASPLKGQGADGRDVGANVVFRHQDGALTAERLWDPASYAFPCGATAADVNDQSAVSCAGIHQRLRIGQAGCALP